MSALELALKEAGLPPLPQGVVERVDAFFALRARWSKTHNLSGPEALARLALDLVDAAAVYQVLGSELLVDVGAGSGVPGLLVACLAPEQPVLLVEPRVKRVAFMRTAVSELSLSRVAVQRGRWPVPITEEAQVVSRAVVSPEAWPALAMSGGPKVRAVLRMLAAHRPQVTVSNLVLSEAVDYRIAGHGQRRIERWAVS